MISRRTFAGGALSVPFLASTSIASAAQDAEQVNLNVSFGRDYAEAVAEGFQTHYPGSSVELSSGGYLFEDGSLQTVLQSGEGPDVLNLNSGPGRIGVIAENGLISAVDDVYERAGLADIFLPDVMDQLQNQTSDGSLHEVVDGLDVFQFYYHKDVFEEHGLQPPESWDDFLAICQTLVDAGRQPLQVGARNNFQGGWLFGNLVQASAGRDVMTEVIFGEGDFTHPDIVRAAEMLQHLVDEDYVNGLEAAALEGAQAEAAFGQGQGIMMVLAQGQVISLGTDGVDLDNIGSFLLPSLNEGQDPAPTSGLATSWVVNAHSDEQDAAKDWLEWAASDEFLRISIEAGGFLVPARTVPDDITLPPVMQDAVDKLAAGSGYNPSVYLPGPVVDAWYAAFQMIITGQASAEESITQIQTALEGARNAG